MIDEKMMLFALSAFFIGEVFLIRLAIKDIFAYRKSETYVKKYKKTLTALQRLTLSYVNGNFEEKCKKHFIALKFFRIANYATYAISVLIYTVLAIIRQDLLVYFKYVFILNVSLVHIPLTIYGMIMCRGTKTWHFD